MSCIACTTEDGVPARQLQCEACGELGPEVEGGTCIEAMAAAYAAGWDRPRPGLDDLCPRCR